MPQQELIIRRVLNGFTVIAGCQTLAFNDTELFAQELANWIRDPEKAEHKYMELYKNMPRPLQPPPLGRPPETQAAPIPANVRSAIDNAAQQVAAMAVAGTEPRPSSPF